MGYSFIFVIFFFSAITNDGWGGGGVCTETGGLASQGRFSMENGLFSPEGKTDFGLSHISGDFSSVVVRRTGGYIDVEL